MAIQGVRELLNKFKEFGQEAETSFTDLLEAGARQIAATAKNNAPANNGQLKQKIQAEEITKFEWEIVAHAPYSAYVEFGTGAKVVVPKEMQDIANAIKNNPKGDIHEAFESIKDWCRDKGIDQRAAWPILMSILDEGLRPRPYLYPAFVQESAKMVKNMNKKLELLSKEFNR